MAAKTDARPRSSLINRIRVGDWIFAALVSVAALTVLLIILGLFYELWTSAWPSIHKFGFAFIWETTWDPPKETFGAGAFIVGTIITSLAALVLATIVGVLVALYLVEIAPPLIGRPI